MQIVILFLHYEDLVKSKILINLENNDYTDIYIQAKRGKN